MWNGAHQTFSGDAHHFTNLLMEVARLVFSSESQCSSNVVSTKWVGGQAFELGGVLFDVAFVSIVVTEGIDGHIENACSDVEAETSMHVE